MPDHAADRSARRAALLMFAAAGWLTAAWATRIPAIAADLDLSSAELGLAVLALEAGAVAGLPGGALAVARAGARRSLGLGFAAFAPALVVVALAPSLTALAAALAVMALANSVVDVAMNAEGVVLERRAGRPLLNGLHAGHPLGLVAGGVAGTAAAGAGAGVLPHLALVAAVALAAVLPALSRLTGAPPAGARRSLPRPGHPFSRPTRRLLLLGVLAFCAFGLDGAASTWSAVSLLDEHDAAPAVGAAAFTGFALTLALGRLAGDRLLGRFGRVRLLRGCAAVTATGGLLVVFAPGAVPAGAGWALLGLGLAAVAPTVLGAAPEAGAGSQAPAAGAASHAPAAGAASPASAIAAVTTLGYLGSFTGPPLIGVLAETWGLSAALLVLPAAAVLLGALAGPALGRRAAPSR